MNRDEARDNEEARAADRNVEPDPDEEAIPPGPDAPQGVIVGAALGGAPGVAVGQSIEGDWPPTEETVDGDDADTGQTD